MRTPRPARSAPLCAHSTRSFPLSARDPTASVAVHDEGASCALCATDGSARRSRRISQVPRVVARAAAPRSGRVRAIRPPGAPAPSRLCGACVPQTGSGPKLGFPASPDRQICFGMILGNHSVHPMQKNRISKFDPDSCILASSCALLAGPTVPRYAIQVGAAGALRARIACAGRGAHRPSRWGPLRSRAGALELRCGRRSLCGAPR